MALAPAHRGPRPRWATPPRGTPDGQATVELVLALPLVVMAMLAIAQVGLVVRDQVLVIHAAREAARAAAVEPGAAAARAAAHAAGPLDPDRMTVEVSGSARPGELVRVLVTYDSSTDLPVVGRMMSDVVLRGAAAMRVER